MKRQCQGIRNTPTGVGKTQCTDTVEDGFEKHPHGRGEDWWTVGMVSCFNRNTPTGVGKTRRASSCFVVLRKHPHGRGEDRKTLSTWPIDRETPPRAWGRPVHVSLYRISLRNTPTGVGKTIHDASIKRGPEKHPHGRGEDPRGFVVLRRASETPPRAWGRQREIIALFAV